MSPCSPRALWGSGTGFGCHHRDVHLAASPCSLSAEFSTGWILLWPPAGSQARLPPSSPVTATLTQGQHREPCPGPHPALGLPGPDPSCLQAQLAGSRCQMGCRYRCFEPKPLPVPQGPARAFGGADPANSALLTRAAVCSAAAVDSAPNTGPVPRLV